jgi:hypothetical protein
MSDHIPDDPIVFAHLPEDVQRKLAQHAKDVKAREPKWHPLYDFPYIAYDAYADGELRPPQHSTGGK